MAFRNIKPELKKSRESDGNMFYSLFFTQEDIKHMVATIKLDGSQTNIYLWSEGGEIYFKILTHNEREIYNSKTGLCSNFMSKDFRNHVKGNSDRFQKTYTYLKAEFPKLKKIIISCEYMFPTCGNLLRKEGVNPNPYPEEYIGKFFAFEIQLFYADSRESIRVAPKNDIFYQHLDVVPTIFEGALTIGNFSTITHWLIENAKSHEGLIISLMDDLEGAIGNKGSFKLRTGITDTSSGPAKLAGDFEPSPDTFPGLMLAMYNKTKQLLPKKADRVKVVKKKPVKNNNIFDIEKINQTVKKVLGHDHYTIEDSEKLRTNIFAQLKKDDLCIVNDKVSKLACKYISGITSDMDKFFKKFN